MSEKIIVILLIAAIIISVFSMIVTLSLNSNDLNIQRTKNVVDKPDLQSSSVGLIITPQPNPSG